MHIANKYNTKLSAKHIKFQRQLRNLNSYINIIMLIASIIFSSFAIYKKQSNMEKLSKIIGYYTKNTIYAVNILDNYFSENSKIKINNLKYINADDLQNDIKNILNSRTNESKIKEIQNKIFKIPFIKHVLIKRMPFRSINVDIEEINVVSFTQDTFSNQKYLIDDEGKYVEYNNQEIQQYNFANIKDFSIDEMDFYIQMYKKIQICKNIANNISEYQNISNRRWDIVLKNGTKIMLPANIEDERINAICSIGNEKLQLFESNSGIEYLDARIKDRFYYKLK